jgi:dimethylaniline monooxygenase (N-oxide forming)
MQLARVSCAPHPTPKTPEMPPSPSVSGHSTAYDILIVGAGLTGLVAAARYLQAHPSAKLALLEHDNCLGGVWSKKRIYPGFWSQTPYGVAEFSDLKMERPQQEDEDCGKDMFRAEHVMEYLERYADSVREGEQSLRERISFRTEVKGVVKVGRVWQVNCVVASTDDTDDPTTKVLFAKKLIMADGLASIPRMPSLPGTPSFTGPIIHSKTFGQSSILTNPLITHITVLGGGKSALDMVYACIQAQKTVSWVLRRTGDGSTGPGFFAPAHTVVPGYANAGLMAQTRVMASLQPSFLREEGWWNWLVNRTRLGVAFVNAVFGKADKALREAARYRERESEKGFEKLEYESGCVWFSMTFVPPFIFSRSGPEGNSLTYTFL